VHSFAVVAVMVTGNPGAQPRGPFVVMEMLGGAAGERAKGPQKENARHYRALQVSARRGKLKTVALF